jgi:hypothetical protein
VACASQRERATVEGGLGRQLHPPADASLITPLRDGGSADGEAGNERSSAVRPIVSQPPRLTSCARDVAASGHPLKDAAELAQGCAGGLRLHTRESRHITLGSPSEFEVDVSENRCLRVLAASDGAQLTVSIIGEHGHMLASGSWGESVAAAPVSGPFCIRVATHLRIAVSATLDANIVAELWQSEGP